MKLKWKLTITHGYDEIMFIFDTLSVAENFLRTFPDGGNDRPCDHAHACTH